MVWSPWPSRNAYTPNTPTTGIETDSKTILDEAGGEWQEVSRTSRIERERERRYIELKKEFLSLQQELEIRKRECESMKEHVAQGACLREALDSRMKEQVAEGARLREALEVSHQDNHAKDEQIRRLTILLRQAEMETKAQEARDMQSRQLLSTRTKELQGAQDYLSIADLNSGEIVGIVEALHSEIYQAAALITDTTESAMMGDICAPFQETSTTQSMADGIATVAGRQLLSLLQNPYIEDPAAVVQNALQALIVRFCDTFIQRWHVEGSVDAALIGIHTAIQRKDRPVVARTWRSLTRAQTKRGAYQTVDFVHILGSSVIQLLTLARWWKPEMQATFYPNFEVRFKAIFEHVSRLDIAIMEGVTSSDIRLYLPQPGDFFEEYFMTNEAEDTDRNHSDSEAGGASTKKRGKVVFVYEMGLLKVEQETPEGEEKTTVMLKSKVILDTAAF